MKYTVSESDGLARGYSVRAVAETYDSRGTHQPLILRVLAQNRESFEVKYADNVYRCDLESDGLLSPVIKFWIREPETKIVHEIITKANLAVRDRLSELSRLKANLDLLQRTEAK